jgi:hypothetical protein
MEIKSDFDHAAGETNTIHERNQKKNGKIQNGQALR